MGIERSSLKFNRYNWSIETRHLLVLILKVLLYLTDTIGVLKLFVFLHDFYILRFNRYNWSIETIVDNKTWDYIEDLTDTIGVLKPLRTRNIKLSFINLTDTIGVLKPTSELLLQLRVYHLTDTIGVLKLNPVANSVVGIAYLTDTIGVLKRK